MHRVPTCSLLVLFVGACGPLVPYDAIGDGDGGSDERGGSDEDTTATTRTVDDGGEDRPGSEVGEADGGVDADDGGDDGTTGVGVSCGDGIVDPGELCDDGNATPGDGCELDCTRSPGIELWSQTVDASADDDSARAVAVDAGGTIFVVGGLETDGNDDAWLRVLDTAGALVGESAIDLGDDEVATSVAVTAGGVYVAGVQPDQDRALLMRVVGTALEPVDGAAPTDIATFTALVSPTAEGSVLVTNTGGFDSLVAVVRRLDGAAQVLGDAAQEPGVFVGTAVPSADGGTILGGGSFGGMGMGGATWLAGLASDASPLWITPGASEPGVSVRIRGLATAPDGSIVAVGTRGQGGPNDDDDEGWVWWWSADGAPQSEGPLEIGGATARPNAVVVGTHGLVVGGTLLTYDDGFVAGLAMDGALQWGYEVVGDAGLEDRISALALAPGAGVVAVGTVTQLENGEDAWIGMFTE